MKDPQPLLYHNEPIWLGNDLIGHITSGAYGHSLGGCIGLGLVPADSVEGDFEIEVAGVRYPADASLRPMYDPKNDRIRS